MTSQISSSPDTRDTNSQPAGSLEGHPLDMGFAADHGYTEHLRECGFRS